MRKRLSFRLPIALGGVLTATVMSLLLAGGVSAQFAYQTCYDASGNSYLIPLTETCTQAGLSSSPTSVSSGYLYGCYQTCYDSDGTPHQILIAGSCAQAGMTSSPATALTGYQTCYNGYGSTYQVAIGQACGSTTAYTGFQTCYDSYGNAYTATAGQACNASSIVGQAGVYCNAVWYSSFAACGLTPPSPPAGADIAW